jgi:WD40 repeat protein
MTIRTTSPMRTSPLHVLLALSVSALLSGCGETALVGEMDPSTDIDPGTQPQTEEPAELPGITSTGGITGTGGITSLTTTGGANGTGGVSATGGTTIVTTEASDTCSSITMQLGKLNPCGRTTGIAYSPDARYLATGTEGETSTVHLWRLSDGMRLPDLDGESTDMTTTYAVAFSPDGTMLASAGYRHHLPNDSAGDVSQVMLWDVASGALLRSLSVNTGWYADAVEFSHDGTLLATGGSMGAVELWRVADGVRVLSVDVPSTAHNVHFSPDDSWVVAGVFDGTARIWNTQTGALVLTLAITEEMADAAFSPDGTQLASTGAGNVIKIWDFATGELLQTLSGHDVYVSHVVWVDQDRLLSNDWEGVVRLWVRDASGSFARTGTYHTGGPSMGLAVSPDKTLFVTGGAATGAAGAMVGFVFFPTSYVFGP